MEILGEICSLATELVVSGAYHFLLLKSDIPTHVSSTQRMTYFLSMASMNLRANCYLNTLFLSELAWMDTATTFLYFIPISSLSILMTSYGLIFENLERAVLLHNII